VEYEARLGTPVAGAAGAAATQAAASTTGVFAGQALEALARKYLQAEAAIDRVGRLIDTDALRAVLDGTPLDLSSQSATESSAQVLQTAMARYRTLAQQVEGDGQVTVSAQQDPRDDSWRLQVERQHHGNVRVSLIDHHFLASDDYSILVDCAQTLSGLISEGAEVRRGEGDRQRSHAVVDFRDAVHWLLSDAERNVGRQRYKGLGEMNAEQLWETTMDASARRLLRVQIEDATAADQIFTTLMGDEVEPRRNFIEKNALGARNIDV